MFEWLVAILVTVNVVFLGVIFFLTKFKKEKMDPLMFSMLGGDNPEKMMMMQMLGGGGGDNFTKMMLLSNMMKKQKAPKHQDLSEELKREVIGELKPMIKKKLKEDAQKELKKYFSLEE